MPSMNSASVPAGLYLHQGLLSAQLSRSGLQLITLLTRKATPVGLYRKENRLEKNEPIPPSNLSPGGTHRAAELTAAPALLLLATLPKPKSSCHGAREALTWCMLYLQLGHPQLLGNCQRKRIFKEKKEISIKLRFCTYCWEVFKKGS